MATQTEQNNQVSDTDRMKQAISKCFKPECKVKYILYSNGTIFSYNEEHFILKGTMEENAKYYLEMITQGIGSELADMQYVTDADDFAVVQHGSGNIFLLNLVDKKKYTMQYSDLQYCLISRKNLANDLKELKVLCQN